MQAETLTVDQHFEENTGTISNRLPKYFPHIDGLRTFAILGVILFHLQIPGMSLGWSGVWLFYVISGFLITGILLDSKAHPNYFKNFYARRVLRIFPIYFTCLFGLYGVALMHGWTVRDIWYYVFYFQNQLLATTQFAPAFPTAYNHTWTLAVEEQFYLLWPLIVWFLNMRLLVATCIMMIILAPLSRALLLHFTHNPFMATNPLVVCLDSFATGGLLAIYIRTCQIGIPAIQDDLKKKRLCKCLWLAISGIILLFVAHYGRHLYWKPTLWLSKVNANIFLTTVLSLWFSTLIFYVVVWDGCIRKILSHKYMVHFGRISYGIYIFHGLVLTYIGVGLHFLVPRLETHVKTNKIAIIFLNLILPYLLALLSWHFLENPFLRLKRRFASSGAVKSTQ